LGLKAGQKSTTLTVERARPSIKLINTHVKPATSYSINYELTEEGVVTQNFKICASLPIDSDGSGQIEAAECVALPGAEITGATGSRKVGPNRFNLKFTTAPANGTVYYLWMDVRDLSHQTPALAKDNLVKVFPLTIDMTPPSVTQFTVTNVVGSGIGTISYHLSEKAFVTIHLRNGSTFEKSKVLRTLVNNVELNASSSSSDLKTASWNGKDVKGKALPNTTTTSKYFIEIRVTDLAGNTFVHSTQNPAWLEILKSPAS
jgi:hypothetical protein